MLALPTNRSVGLHAPVPSYTLTETIDVVLPPAPVEFRSNPVSETDSPLVLVTATCITTTFVSPPVTVWLPGEFDPLPAATTGSVAVAVTVGVTVQVAVGVEVKVEVTVFTGVLVEVGVNCDVFVGVPVKVAVRLGVAVDVWLAVGLAVAVKVTVGVLVKV